MPYGEHRVVAKEMEEPSGRHKSVGKRIALVFSLTEKTVGPSANTESPGLGVQGVVSAGHAVVRCLLSQP